MRNRILELLRGKGPSYLSGEEMARILSISRTAVWKNVQALQADGYVIESSPRRGYRLVGVPDLLLPAEITRGIHPKLIASSREKIHHYRQVDSTNNILKDLADKGAPEGTVAVAEEQTGGRGRMGRTWSAPFGKGICLSILLKPPLAPRDTPLFTLLAAAAVVKSLLQNLPGLTVGIKWPNDILVHGRKVCGILTELKAEADLLHYIIIGIGVNVNFQPEDFPPEFAKSATSLFLANNNQEISRQRLAGSLLYEMDCSYLEYLRTGPEIVLTTWERYNLTLGKYVTLNTVNGSFSGKAVALANDGALIIEDEKGRKKSFHAGEVTLKKFPNLDEPVHID